MANAAVCKLGICWISSHSRVKGNEAVDQLAKEAAAGRSSPRAKLSQILCSPLPISALAIKQKYISTLKTNWTQLWRASPQRARTKQLGGVFPFSTLQKQFDNLSRKQASLILQLWCVHFPLNTYLHRIAKFPMDNCQECTDDQDISTAEMINHFIFACPAHHQARREIIASRGENNFYLPKIMSNTDYIKALTIFINRTGRFKNQDQPRMNHPQPTPPPPPPPPLPDIWPNLQLQEIKPYYLTTMTTNNSLPKPISTPQIHTHQPSQILQRRIWECKQSTPIKMTGIAKTINNATVTYARKGMSVNNQLRLGSMGSKHLGCTSQDASGSIGDEIAPSLALEITKLNNSSQLRDYTNDYDRYT